MDFHLAFGKRSVKNYTEKAMSQFYIFVPIVVSIITAIVAPIYLSKRQTTGTLTAAVIQEGKDIRMELRQRIESLEKRLDDANDEINKALDQLRNLRGENENCVRLVENLKKELAAHQGRLDDLEDNK